MSDANPNSAPKVAIVIPVYNRSADLKVLLRSVYALEYKNFEVIVVDNGSTDSLEWLPEMYPDVLVLRKEKNYGATVGFNTGLEYAGSSGDYDYVWMLDSDLMVDGRSLPRLVEVMELDSSIGLAGPKILNSADKSLVVEAGARISLAEGKVFPLYCNEPDFDGGEVIEVDYHGSGVSLVRAEAFRKAGGMDERYYFLWDDMDYGLLIKRKGYKVVAVTDAVVYHPAFTEKRSAAINAYYGIKGPLLTASKYADPVSRLRCVYGTLRTVFKLSIYRFLSGYGRLAGLSMHALWDFAAGRWGEMEEVGAVASDAAYRPAGEPASSMDARTVAILPSGTDKDVARVLGIVRAAAPEARIILVMQDYRRHLFESIGADEILGYDDKGKGILIEHARLFLTLMARRPDVVINTDPERGSPFTYAGRRVLDWDSGTEALYESRENLSSIWKIPVSVIAGELFALAVCPFLYIMSFKYSLKNRE
ncbi:MAG: glycosyltransferase [Candidatus Dadabacteria bacterium]